MKFTHMSLRLRVFLFFALIVVIAGAGFVGAMIFAWRAGADASTLVQGGLGALGILTAITLWVWFKFDEHVVYPIVSLANTLKTNANADQVSVIEAVRDQAKYLGDLGPSVEMAATALLHSRTEVNNRIEAQTAQLSHEKARIEALLHDLREGVLACNLSHRITLFNRAVLHDLNGQIGLGRSVFGSLQRDSIEHALSRLIARNAHNPGERNRETLMVETNGRRRILRGHMSLITEEGTPTGYVLALTDVTEEMHARGARRAELRELANTLEAPCKLLNNLISGANAPLEHMKTARKVLEDHIHAMQANSLATKHHLWPMGTVSCAELSETIRHQMRGAEADLIDVSGCSGDILIHCDEYAISHVMARMSALGSGKAKLQAFEDGPNVKLCMTWDSGCFDPSGIDAALDGSLPEGYGDNSLRDAVEGHGIALCLVENGIELPLQRPQRLREAQPIPDRPEFYDFSLAQQAYSGLKEDTPLDQLTYVVFDTETTGLNPAGGDEIVEIAALRVVNGRILRGDVFETLVKPNKRIPKVATEIHGITNERVADAPSIKDAGARFHDFAEDAVLVAHNAPFDMAFLRRQQDLIGRRFDHPTVDTVMMSAMLFGQEGDHTLDALVTRFGVKLPEDLRHTAMGDTAATAEVFINLMRMIKAEGYTTLGELLEASSDIRAIRRKQAAYGGGD